MMNVMSKRGLITMTTTNEGPTRMKEELDKGKKRGRVIGQLIRLMT